MTNVLMADRTRERSSEMLSLVLDSWALSHDTASFGGGSESPCERNRRASHCHVGADLKLARAGQLKARFEISLADAFAAALAKVNKAELVTGDEEFRSLSKRRSRSTGCLAEHWARISGGKTSSPWRVG
jgi:hypothetical protein